MHTTMVSAAKNVNIFSPPTVTVLGRQKCQKVANRLKLLK